MRERDLYSVVAGILPILLGLGLIELYVERGVTFGVVATSMVALAVVAVVIAALVDASHASQHRPRRARRRSSKP